MVARLVVLISIVAAAVDGRWLAKRAPRPSLVAARSAIYSAASDGRVSAPDAPPPEPSNATNATNASAVETTSARRRRYARRPLRFLAGWVNDRVEGHMWGMDKFTSSPFVKFFVTLSVYYMAWVSWQVNQDMKVVTEPLRKFEEGVGRSKFEIERQARAAARAAEEARREIAPRAAAASNITARIVANATATAAEKAPELTQTLLGAGAAAGKKAKGIAGAGAKATRGFTKRLRRRRR